jgi:FKBP-type peptidyl-prolyl cis-trans isomerase
MLCAILLAFLGQEPPVAPVYEGPPQLVVTPPGECEDLVIGDGPAVVAGDRVTLAFVVSTDAKEIANSERRGLPFSMTLDGPGADPVLSAVTAGMAVGGHRRAFVSSDLYGRRGLVPPGVLLRVEVRLLAVRPPSPATSPAVGRIWGER